MKSLIEKLTARGPVITDGAWGTRLQARGLAVGACPDEWNLSRAADVESVAREYVEAGSDIVLTNTFGASRTCLERHGLADRVVEINRRGAEISRRAAGDRARVFASMGPCGKLLVTGEVDRDDLGAAFREQAGALAEGGAHAIVIETMADLDEALLALGAARSTGLPVVACMVYDSGPGHDRTMMGVTPERAAEALSEAGADAVGANCGQGIDGYVEICRRLALATDRPVWIKANAGLPELVDGQPVYRTSAEEFAARLADLIEAGAQFVGGCCGTDPGFIRALRSALA